MERQPSSATSVSLDCWTISGLMTARTSCSSGWKTKRRRRRNFRPGADAAIRALGGPTLWMRRLHAIEEELDRHEAELAEAWRELAQATPDAATFEREWREIARRWSFAAVNELIESHNP